MQQESAFLKAIEKTKEILDDVTFLFASRRKPTYFVRNGNNKLTFKSTVLFHLSLVRKSLQLELDDFFKKFHEQSASITKQGFTEARRKIDPFAFSHLFEAIADNYYVENPYETFRGYRLCAVDGTTVKLNGTEALTDYFGTATNQKVHRTRAKASALYDVENQIFLRAKIAPYVTSERDLARELIDHLPSTGATPNLFLFDRGYPSRDFVDYLKQHRTNFVMRCPKSGVMAEVKDTTKADENIQMTYEGKTWDLRVVRFEFDSGEEEILLTNVMDKSYTVQDFKKLYFKRWGIEVKYDTLKNKLQMENFSGATPLTIKQDFYASLYLINMASLLQREATEKITQEDRHKWLKHSYKANMNRVIGKLKEYFILLFGAEEKVVQQLYGQLLDETKRDETPERPGRNNPRTRPLRSNRFALNKKGCLP